MCSESRKHGFEAERRGRPRRLGSDREGQTVDFFLSEQRDIAAAKRFLQQAIEKRGVPQKIMLDGYAASHVAVGELQDEGILPAELLVRTNRYLNNMIEEDHRRVKQRVRPMLNRTKRDWHSDAPADRSRVVTSL